MGPAGPAVPAHTGKQPRTGKALFYRGAGSDQGEQPLLMSVVG